MDDKWNVQNKTTDDLNEMMVNYKDTSEQHVSAKLELEKRRYLSLNLKWWISIGISAIALIISILAIFRK